VVGIGLGERDAVPSIQVFVVERTPRLVDAIPSEIAGHPVQVEETGELRALDDRTSS
jgi:hypothetical protein